MWIPQQEASSSHVPLSTNVWISSQLTRLGIFRRPHLGLPLPEGKSSMDLAELELGVSYCITGGRVE